MQAQHGNCSQKFQRYVSLSCWGNVEHSLISSILQTFLQQFHQDDNVRSLLQAIHDAFAFVIEADVLRNMEPASTQVKILDEMLECISECATFIISYAEDVHIGTSS
jgi:hypothetical protein